MNEQNAAYSSSELNALSLENLKSDAERFYNGVILPFQKEFSIRIEAEVAKFHPHSEHQLGKKK